MSNRKKPKLDGVVRARRRAAQDRQRAKTYWAGLDDAQRWDLGDELVLGDVDDMRWFGRRESKAFMTALDKERLYWEQTR